MKKYVAAACVALALCVGSTSANAALSKNGQFVTDSVSGLNWLMLTNTVNMSYAQAEQAYPQLRHATFGEWTNLINQYYPELSSSQYGYNQSFSHGAQFFSDFGGVLSGSPQAGTYFSIGDVGLNGPTHEAAIFYYADYGTIYKALVGISPNPNIQNMIVGQFMVTAAPVPEPGEWAMMAGGLAIISGIARRRKWRD